MAEKIGIFVVATATLRKQRIWCFTSSVGTLVHLRTHYGWTESNGCWNLSYLCKILVFNTSYTLLRYFSFLSANCELAINSELIYFVDA